MAGSKNGSKPTRLRIVKSGTSSTNRARKAPVATNGKVAAKSKTATSGKAPTNGKTAAPAPRKLTDLQKRRARAMNHRNEAELDQTVRDYMPLVRHAVNRIAVGASSAGILQYEDMVSCGVQGLIEAYYSYDPNRGAKFSTYALPRIRGSILDALRAAHPLPRSLQKFSSDMESANAQLHTKLGRSPSRAEVAKEMGLTQKEFMNTLKTSSIRVVSLDGLAETAVNGNTEKLWEMADEDPSIDPDSMAQDTMVRRMLHDAVELLPDRERTIVHLYYMRAHSLKSIGKALGISESRASQLRHRAIRRLRTALNGELKDAA